MLALRKSLNRLPGVEVLEFNWISGKGPDLSKNTFVCDMGNVHQADLMVGVLDYPSTGLGMEILERCKISRPMLLFHSVGTRVSQIVRDCILYHQSIACAVKAAELPDPIEFDHLEHIVYTTDCWIRSHPKDSMAA